MSNVVRIATSRPSPMKRACSTCDHLGYLERCKALDRYIMFERRDSGGVCGKDGLMWEPKKGIVEKVRQYFVGAR